MLMGKKLYVMHKLMFHKSKNMRTKMLKAMEIKIVYCLVLAFNGRPDFLLPFRSAARSGQSCNYH